MRGGLSRTPSGPADPPAASAVAGATGPRRTAARAWRRILFAFGLAASTILLWRGQTGGDQLNLVTRGWLWAERGIVTPHGNPLSNGGNEPGALTTWITGAPLLLWRDARAPVVIVLLAHLAAHLLIDRWLRRAGAGEVARLLWVVLFWLNPWRIYLSGHLWNPNYLFGIGAAHLVTAWATRRHGSSARARFWGSTAHVLALSIAFQLHPSFVILLFASVVLWWRGLVRPHWGGVIAGAAISLAMLAPWISAAAADPSILPGEKGFPLRGLLYVFPFARGVLYWLRYASLYVSSSYLRLDFRELIPSPGAEAALRLALRPLTQVLAPASVLLALWANMRFFRADRRRIGRLRRSLAGAAFIDLVRPRWGIRAPRPSAPLAWLRRYVAIAFAAALLAFALAPTTVMPWQGIPVFHAAVLAPLLVARAALRGRAPVLRQRARRALAAFLFLAVLLVPVIAFGAPHYTCGGPEIMGLGLVLRHDHPMFHDLGLWTICPYPLDPATGWWPDVLPED